MYCRIFLLHVRQGVFLIYLLRNVLLQPNPIIDSPLTTTAVAVLASRVDAQ